MNPSDNRRIYRVAIKDGIRAKVTTDTGRVPVELVDLNGSGAGLFVSSSEAPKLAEAGTVELLFSLKGKRKEVQTRARVAWSKVVVSEAGPGKHVGVQFLEPALLHAQLDFHLWRYFNRRTSRRAFPTPDSVPARIAHPKGTLDGWLGDLSPLGFAVELPRTVPVIALPGQNVGTVFTIPGSSSPARFQAQVIYRLAKARTNRLGLAIDGALSPGFDLSRQAIVDYLAASPEPS